MRLENRNDLWLEKAKCNNYMYVWCVTAVYILKPYLVVRLNMANSQDAMLLIVAFLWSFIYVKFTWCHALLLWHFVGLLSMSNSQDNRVSYCGLSLVFYLCQVHKMLYFVIVAFLWSFIYANIARNCVGSYGISSFIYAKFTRCCALLLCPFHDLLSMPNSQDSMLSNCGLSLIFYLCQVHKTPCFVIVAFLWSFFNANIARDCALFSWHLVFYLCQIHKVSCFVIGAYQEAVNC